MDSPPVFRFRAFSLVLWLGAGTVACGSGNDDQSRVCDPGHTIQCAGPKGCVGSQSCSVDGSGYDACSCGSVSTTVPNNQGTGGVGSGAHSSASTTGTAVTYFSGGSPASTGGTGTGIDSSTGGALTNTGGSPAISTANCAAASMAGYKYPSYVPARRMAQSCTEQAILQYFTDCYTAGECSAFSITGSQSQCGACLTPTELTATAYGPLLRIGTPNAYFYQTNVAGCEELLGETDCAPKMQVESLCEYLSCANSCPLKDGSGYYDALYRCMADARTSQCSQERQAATCLTNTASITGCSGSSFEQQFVAIAKVFCG